MAQGVLSFKYEEERRDTGMTALAGLPVYLDLASVMGIAESVARHIHVKRQGWTDAQMVLALVLLNLSGGECVDDLRKLEGDGGFCRVLRRVEQKGMRRRHWGGAVGVDGTTGSSAGRACFCILRLVAEAPSTPRPVVRRRS